MVLPSSGSRWRGQDEGSGLPAVVTGPKRRGGVSGLVAGKAGAKGTKRTRGRLARVRGEAGESSRGLSGKRWTHPLLLGLFPGVRGWRE
ncbi:hypothetical protein [Saccharopolyspora spinosa]|uniref:hypothetical protein n=1 Tax=Saccharopolyspora spinosa TaxID=60894 RepID=UPI00376EEE68